MQRVRLAEAFLVQLASRAQAPAFFNFLAGQSYRLRLEEEQVASHAASASLRSPQARPGRTHAAVLKGPPGVAIPTTAPAACFYVLSLLPFRDFWDSF